MFLLLKTYGLKFSKASRALEPDSDGSLGYSLPNSQESLL